MIKGELSFNEEYTIEALFHESVHSKIKKQPENILQLAVLETCTQLYARNNYTKIFSFMSSKTLLFDDIKLNGYGYKSQCNILREYFTKNNELQVGELINIANGTEDGIKILKQKFNQKEIPIQKQKEIFELMKTTIK